MPRPIRSLAVVLATGLVVFAAASASAQIEDYADYQPQTTCSPKAKPGTKALGRWLVKRGGSGGPSARSCKSGGTSEHKEGRAFDWMLDARSKKDRQVAAEFLSLAFATDGKGNTHAKARRMGIMYIIWNDHIYSASRRFDKKDYLSSSCSSKKKCSATLRHRNHVHISLTRAGGRGDTSWYVKRVPS